jgi:HK97 family phage portal protein
VLAETVAQLPLKVYRRLPDGGREEAPTHPLYPILHDSPNSEMDSFTYRESSTAGLVNWGNWYSEIFRAGNKHIIALNLIHPSNVTPKRSENDGSLYYSVNDQPSGQPRNVSTYNMLHVVGSLSSDGITGRGVIKQARESIGMGMATEAYGAEFFGNGARPGGVIEHPGTKALSQDAADGLAKHWDNIHQGVGRTNKVAVLREGMTYKPIGLPPEEAQFLETRMHNITEIARWYRLPPHMLSDLSNAHFTNIEHESLNFVKYSIVPWLVRIERAINKQLFTNSEFFAEFTVDGLLRGDKLSRSEANAMEFTNGKLTLNDWLKQDNMNPIKSEFGDTHFVPANLVPLDKVNEAFDQRNAASAPAPDSEPNEPADPKSTPGKPKENNMAVTAAEKAILDVERRMCAIEVNTLRRAAKTPDKFISKVDAFYEKHLTVTKAAFDPVMDVYDAVSENSEEHKKYHRLHFTKSLPMGRQAKVIEACDCSPAELPAVVEKLTQLWISDVTLQTINKEDRVVWPGDPEDNHVQPEN